MKTVLLIDDEPDLREVVKLSLEFTTDWSIVTASSGIEGIRVAQEIDPDGILLDVMMPVMDGPATLAQLREDVRTQRIPVCFLTAKVQSSERELFRGMGADGIIAKPFDPLNLASLVAQAFSWSGL